MMFYRKISGCLLIELATETGTCDEIQKDLVLVKDYLQRVTKFLLVSTVQDMTKLLISNMHVGMSQEH